MIVDSSIFAKFFRYFKRLIYLPHTATETLERFRRLEVAPSGATDPRSAPTTPPVSAAPAEFPAEGEVYKGYTAADLSVFDLFNNVQPKPEPGFVTDFLGTRTRTQSLWEAARQFDGQVLGRPVPHDLFEAIEWIGLLKAVASAKGNFSMMELGAGWGPWLAAGAVASSHLGIKDVELLGVEADPGRFDLMRQHFIDNGLDPDAHTLLCAAVGTVAGHARWPKISDAPNAGGGRPIRENKEGLNKEDADYIPHAVHDYIDVEIVAFADLLRRRPGWDLVHIDVQGWEAELIANAVELLNERVRWLVVGTHSRALDGALISTLHRAGWVLENEKPTRFVYDAAKESLETMAEVDGAQIWRNPRLCSALDIDARELPSPQSVGLDGIDAVLDRADALMSSDYSAAIGILNDVNVSFVPPPHTSSPFSKSYADWVMSTYLRVADVSAYEPQKHEADGNARTDIQFSKYFPYNTQDLSFIGRYMTGVGMILSELQIPAGSHVVEYGVGWGHVAAALARSGYKVTCVDIEAKFLQLAQRQAEALGCSVETHHGEFGDSPFSDGVPRADAVVFFEAFHHSFEHLTVLRQLRKTVLRPGGVLILAAEPVHPAFPVPWGVRPDGHALWALRRHKWMELGFQEDYLIEALLREGFLVSRTHIEELGSFGLLYRAQLHEGKFTLGETLLPSGQATSWAQSSQGERHLWALADSVATLDQDPTWTTVTITFVNHLPVALTASISTNPVGEIVRRRFEPGERAEIALPLPQSDRKLRIQSETVSPASLGMNNDSRLLGIAVEVLTYGT